MRGVADFILKTLHDGIDFIFGVINCFRQFDIGVAGLDDDRLRRRLCFGKRDVSINRLDVEAKDA